MFNINNKGFTLVELMVVLAISGIILIMAIPSINNTSNEARDREYTEYRDSIIYGARLYYKRRSSDLDWNASKTEAVISFNDLKEANLVKDFVPTQKSSKKGCNTADRPGDVSVKITKSNNTTNNSKVSYEVVGLKCGVGTNKKEIK